MYYRSTAAYGDTVWQLFVDGAPLTAARWPNALAWTDDAWSRDRGWASQAAGSSCGVSVDKGTAEPAEGEVGHQSLAATGVSFNGCNVIMNNEHWVTRRYTVANHAAGTGTFDYETDSNVLCRRYGTDVDGWGRATSSTAASLPSTHRASGCATPTATCWCGCRRRWRRAASAK